MCKSAQNDADGNFAPVSLIRHLIIFSINVREKKAELTLGFLLARS